MMKITGRKREKDILSRCLQSERPEFLVVYGRRRVGKTFLVKEYFNGQFSFYATGISGERTGKQLRAFNDALIRYGSSEHALPKDWFEAFSRLRDLLSRDSIYREPTRNKIIIFLDELPWMDTARSGFKSALDYFWNSWASSRPDILLIVCGSATSWIVDNLLNDTGGFHNRVTKRMRLMPFTLKECEELMLSNDFSLPREQIMDCYMVFGGIPYYMNLLDRRLSLAQNIDELCFKEYGDLRDEYDNLFASLFKKPGKHLSIIQELSTSKSGMTRQMLSEKAEIGGGSVLTKDLIELERCGFIRKYSDFLKPSNGAYYQLVDPFILFALRFIKGGRGSWMTFVNSAGYNAWRGNSFEILCLNHIQQIKNVLGISGVDTSEYEWRSDKSVHGAQIDLIIDRQDGVINLCEMKCTNDSYGITKDEYDRILNRMSVFQEETGTRKSLHVTIISARGIKDNKYSDVAQNVISGEDLFCF